ncbi:MAG: bifunctional oligoribonuclease/PAP phosphatase NrnA [Bacteroidales bacterium]|nr:bifunctional oligoribonuclease/PAP phosphatase NrnA [Anaerotignum sp.]MCI5680256.1 bifunctional oligoribonuclease/PAP phosphatase NrnA [Bacteroidales bacterium]MDY3926015.1 bifunctional oligoribonuclease/PAP phosphatase NrnA [Anaerotignum sp.]
MMKANDSFEKIMECILSAETITLAGHINPDGDAIGACLALGGALEKSGKKVQVVLEKYADKYHLIPNGYLVCEAEKAEVPELFIALDCGDEGRLGAAAEIFQKAAKKINIDHHGSNSFFGELNYVDADASSTSEIIFRLLKDRLPITAAEAAGLYAGLIYDTGGFRHSSTSPETMKIAGKLMGYGIPFTEIYNRFFDSRSFSELKIMGKALDNAELLFGGDVVCSTITTAEIEALGGSNKELDAIINYLKGVLGAKVACFFYEKTETDVKGSFRGNDGYDVCALAQKFGGGGHVKAAGCTISAPIAEAKAMVLAEVEKML